MHFKSTIALSAIAIAFGLANAAPDERRDISTVLFYAMTISSDPYFDSRIVGQYHRGDDTIADLWQWHGGAQTILDTDRVYLRGESSTSLGMVWNRNPSGGLTLNAENDPLSVKFNSLTDKDRLYGLYVDGDANHTIINNVNRDFTFTGEYTHSNMVIHVADNMSCSL
jgi:hypothetical protein